MRESVLEQHLELLRDGIAFTRGAEHLVEHVNGAFCALARRPREGLVGRRLVDALPGVDGAMLDRVLASGNAESLTGHPGGERRTRGCEVARTSDGLVVTVRDATDLVPVRGEQYDALVAHALRAPLTALLVFASTLQRSLRSQGLDADADVAERIERNGGRIGAMIGEILEAATLERGDVALQRVPLELSEIVAACVDRLDGAARYRVVVEATDSPFPVLGDPGHLESAITNLVANALDGSPADAPVRLVLGHIGGDVALDVIDRGPGVAPDERAALFDRFHRGAQSGTSGLGLGLYIVRLVAEGHGGRVELRPAPGGGSILRLLLPSS